MKKYLLSITTVQCPECRVPWGDEYIAANLTKVFINNELKARRAQLLFDEARIRFPAYQDDAMRFKKAKEFMTQIKTAIDVSKENYKKSEYSIGLDKCMEEANELFRVSGQYTAEVLKKIDEIDAYKKNNKSIKPTVITEQQFRLSSLGFTGEIVDNYHISQSIIAIIKIIVAEYGKAFDINAREHEVRHYDKHTNKDAVMAFINEHIGEGAIIDGVEGAGAGAGAAGTGPKRREFIRGCPVDGCKGYLNKNWICGLCEVHVCDKCNVPKKDDHSCKEDDIATAKMLRKDTKACPKCAALISKIDGCDQMWCIQCHTTFHWRTGLIEDGHTHNPHYYEWLRRTQGSVPRTPGDAEGAAGGAAGPQACPDDGDIVNGVAVLKIMTVGFMVKHINGLPYIWRMREYINDRNPIYSIDTFNKYIGYIMFYWSNRWLLYNDRVEENHEDNYEETLRTLIVMHLQNMIDEEVMQRALINAKLGRASAMEHRNILLTVMYVIRDTILDIVYDRISIEAGCENIDKAVEFGKDTTYVINKKYGSKHNKIIQLYYELIDE